VSLDAMHWVRKHSKSKGAARLIMMGIADAAPGPDCVAWASYQYLMEWVGTTRPSTVADALKTLFTSGELKVVEGRKGPYGSTCYQLPLAIGHERPRARNHSAHRSDPAMSDHSGESSDPPSEITPLTGVPPLRSPEGSEGQSLRSPEYRTSYLPLTTSSPDAPAHDPALDTTGGGGGQKDKPNRGPAVTLISTLDYLGQWPASAERDQLVEAAHRALTAGWTESDLRKQLDLRGGDGIRSATAVYLARLAKLPAPPAANQPAPSHIRPWCGHCNRGEQPASIAQRTHDGPDGRPVKCRCHPGYQPAAA
jgi:hypothetical protein